MVTAPKGKVICGPGNFQASGTVRVVTAKALNFHRKTEVPDNLASVTTYERFMERLKFAQVTTTAVYLSAGANLKNNERCY